MPPRPVIPVEPRWRRRIAASGHRLKWTGRRLVCATCQVCKPFGGLLLWLNQGMYPGVPSAAPSVSGRTSPSDACENPRRPRS